MALDVCVREGDETKVYRGDLADKYLREHSVPRSTAEYIVNEPSFRILRPEYSRFIRRDDIETTLWTAIADPRCYVTHLTGFGGIGKTAIALWFALELFEKHRFDYIVTASARDRALTRSGIVETSPTLTSYEQLIETILDVLGFAVELQGLTINEKAQWTLDLLQGTNTLLVLDNLETVDDERIFQFIDNLPLPVRTIATSRVQRIQKSVFPVHVGQMSPAQSLRLIGQLVAGPTKGSLEGLQKSERDLIATRCLHIPLAIEWIIARAATAAEALELSNQLTQYSATSDELLEFSFRRVYLSLPESEKNVLGAVAVFDSPQPVEALAAGAGLNALECMDAIESLRLSHLVIELQSESSIGTKVYDANTLVKRFAYVSLSERAGQEQGIRRKLSAWYDALDVKDPDERAVVSEIRKGNRDPEATFTSLGSQLRKQGKYDAADRCLKTAIERRPTSWKAYRERGELFREQKHIRSALEMYELASKYAPKKGPDRALIFRELGMLLPVRATASCGAW
jgi:tetratricopeptide (TPR) repeat protein